ncbi:hypothetical protein EM20IM_00385 [Candidatus Methylacidiphilum infernorum]|uniref:Uncharacterized protein n=1 Tax=Candidatus Methylacidiphilum infernorum TaxID=511746 RepID=A0ABX7PV92_9BACT|nr:hypothetical protein [Candidatus Methylacidiphilum infernorum]QSR86867.1 hypothetical protein EM20IM_00385 [Candidatus Methylacidiphilum infernorum]
MKVCRYVSSLLFLFSLFFLSNLRADDSINYFHLVGDNVTESGVDIETKIFYQLYENSVQFFYQFLAFPLALSLIALGLGIIKRKKIRSLVVDCLISILLFVLIFSGILQKVFNPTRGIFFMGIESFIGQIKIGENKIRGKYPKEWWDNWLFDGEGTKRSKLSIEYSQRKSQVLGKNYGYYEELESQLKEKMEKFVPFAFPPEKIKNLLLSLMIVMGKGIFHSLLFFSYLISQLSLFFYFLIPLVLNFIEQCLFYLSFLGLFCFALLLPSKPCLRLLGKSYYLFLGSVIPMVVWMVLSYLSFIFLATLYDSVFENRSSFLALYHSASQEIHHALSKSYLLASFLNLFPETHRIVFLGFWELSWEAGFYCLITLSIALLLFLGMVIPLWGLLRSLRLFNGAPMVAIRFFKKSRFALGRALGRQQLLKGCFGFMKNPEPDSKS